jgi:diacylglycerol kinase family enzyme
MNITTEGREIRRSAFFIAVGNALSYGGGMKVTPQARSMKGCWTFVWSAT